MEPLFGSLSLTHGDQASIPFYDPELVSQRQRDELQRLRAAISKSNKRLAAAVAVSGPDWSSYIESDYFVFTLRCLSVSELVLCKRVSRRFNAAVVRYVRYGLCESDEAIHALFSSCGFNEMVLRPSGASYPGAPYATTLVSNERRFAFTTMKHVVVVDMPHNNNGRRRTVEGLPAWQDLSGSTPELCCVHGDATAIFCNGSSVFALDVGSQTAPAERIPVNKAAKTIFDVAVFGGVMYYTFLDEQVYRLQCGEFSLVLRNAYANELGSSVVAVRDSSPMVEVSDTAFAFTMAGRLVVVEHGVTCGRCGEVHPLNFFGTCNPVWDDGWYKDRVYSSYNPEMLEIGGGGLPDYEDNLVRLAPTNHLAIPVPGTYLIHIINYAWRRLPPGSGDEVPGNRDAPRGPPSGLDVVDEIDDSPSLLPGIDVVDEIDALDHSAHAIVDSDEEEYYTERRVSLASSGSLLAALLTEAQAVTVYHYDGHLTALATIGIDFHATSIEMTHNAIYARNSTNCGGFGPPWYHASNPSVGEIRSYAIERPPLGDLCRVLAWKSADGLISGAQCVYIWVPAEFKGFDAADPMNLVDGTDSEYYASYYHCMAARGFREQKKDIDMFLDGEVGEYCYYKLKDEVWHEVPRTDRRINLAYLDPFNAWAPTFPPAASRRPGWRLQHSTFTPRISHASE